MKKFKTKRKRKIFKIFFYISITYISFIFTFNFLKKDTKIDPEKYIKSLINTGFNNQLNKKQYNNSFIFSNPITLIENNLSFKASKNTDNIEKETTKYIESVNKEMDEPLIYIYNSHDKEEYKIEYKYEYSIVPNVKLASYILQEKLENLKIPSIVETKDIKNILNQNNWLYRDSYRASRILLEQTKEINSIKYYIDIHRDSSRYEKTILEYNNQKYAKVLFIVGLEHDNYEQNLSIATKLSNIVNEKIPNLSKGILKKEGPGVNGIYNQDFSPNLVLIEIGGQDNNIIEVSNTINILGEALYSYIKEEL
ncbi:MAG: stage II sporulation protein P [Bacilli bacterium]|nr:stage II sporulation protein P [Bacilli bacterium]